MCLLQYEPPSAALFVYSVVDRTTRQAAIESWFDGNQEAWLCSGRQVRTLLRIIYCGWNVDLTGDYMYAVFLYRF